MRGIRRVPPRQHPRNIETVFGACASDHQDKRRAADCFAVRMASSIA
jgi:hypothetical protein